MEKILFISHDDMRGGSSRSMAAQISFLKNEKKIEPIVVTWGENSLTAYLRERKIQCYAMKYDFTSVWSRNKLFQMMKMPYYRLFYNSIAYRKLGKFIDLSKISLIVSNSSVADFGAYLRRKLRIPHVWYLREFGDLDFNILSYVKNLPRYIDENSDGIIAVSNAVARHWKKRGVKKQIEVIPNGVFDKDFPWLRRKNSSAVKICMCGRLCPAKGQDVAVKAIALLPQSVVHRIHLDFFGVGESEKFLRDLVRKEKLEKIISFNGFSEKLEDVLRNYEIGLTLSKAEAFGRTTVEYMGHALFVVATNTGGTPELLQNGKFGTLVDSNDPQQVADAIEDYCINRNECKKMALQAQLYARAEFAVSKNAEQAYLFYKKIMMHNC